MKKSSAIILVSLVAALSTAAQAIESARSVPVNVTEQKPAETPVLLAQSMPVYHVINNLGIWFWGTTLDMAMYACQQNTTYDNGMCYPKGFW
jgi:hypothetical protein